jgi:branched-chain amino acid aminotransferase
MFYKVLHGEIKAIENPNLSRGFHYGDGFFESMYLENDTIPLFEFHYKRICKSFDILKLDKNMLPSSEGLYNKIIDTLLVKNKYRIRIDFTRESEGLYFPDRNDVVFSISHKALHKNLFEISSQTYKLGVYKDNYKSCTPISTIKSKNALVYVLASIAAHEQLYDDVIILNEKEHVAETISSNLFIVKNGEIITPPLSDAGVDGVMRTFIIDKIKKSNYIFFEKSITIDDVKLSDEIFVCNAVKGIQPVSEFMGEQKSIIFINQIFKNILK